MITCGKIFTLWLLFEPFFRFSKSYVELKDSKREINKFMDILVDPYEKEYKSKIKSKDFKPQMFLDKFYKIRDTMSLEQMKDWVFSFLVGGYDTTGMTIPTVLLLLAMHQEEQEKVYKELSGICGDQEIIDFAEENLEEMKYLEMVIKESLRMIPVALIIGRTVKKELNLSN